MITPASNFRRLMCGFGKTKAVKKKKPWHIVHVYVMVLG